MRVSLTEKAAVEVKKIMTEQNLPEGTVLRVGVQGGGCSGFSYSLGFDTSTSDLDRIVDIHGIKLAVEKKFDPYLDGTVWIFTTAWKNAGSSSTTPTFPRAVAADRRSRSDETEAALEKALAAILAGSSAVCWRVEDGDERRRSRS